VVERETPGREGARVSGERREKEAAERGRDAGTHTDAIG
jgi:hypothetical protein